VEKLKYTSEKQWDFLLRASAVDCMLKNQAPNNIVRCFGGLVDFLSFLGRGFLKS